MASGTALEELETMKAAADTSFLDQVGPHAGKIVIGAAAVGFLSLFMPAVNVTVLGISQSVSVIAGWEGKLGLLAYIAVGVLAGITLKKNPEAERGKILACLITAGVAALLSVFLFFDVSRGSSGLSAPGMGVGISTGFGTYLNILASLVLAGGAAILAKRAKVF
jgi:hypothetical protein